MGMGVDATSPSSILQDETRLSEREEDLIRHENLFLYKLRHIKGDTWDWQPDPRWKPYTPQKVYSATGYRVNPVLG